MALLAKSLEFLKMKQKLNIHQLYLNIWKCLHCTLWQNYVLSIYTKTQFLAQTDISIWAHEFGIQYSTLNNYHRAYIYIYIRTYIHIYFLFSHWNCQYFSLEIMLNNTDERLIKIRRDVEVIIHNPSLKCHFSICLGHLGDPSSHTLRK